MGLNDSRPLAEVSQLLIPEPLVRDRLDRAFLRTDTERDTQRKLMTASNEVYNFGRIEGYFSLHGSVATQYGEDYVELYQIYGPDNRWAPMWGTRLYRSGTITRRSVVVSEPIDGKIWQSWYEDEIRGTLIFAAEAYKQFGVADIDEIRVLSVLRGVDRLPLMVSGRLGVPIELSPAHMEPNTVSPTRERITVRQADLRSNAESIAKEFARLLRMRYTDSPIVAP